MQRVGLKVCALWSKGDLGKHEGFAGQFTILSLTIAHNNIYDSRDQTRSKDYVHIVTWTC